MSNETPGGSEREESPILRRAIEVALPPVYCKLRPFDPDAALAERPVATVKIGGEERDIYGATEMDVVALKEDLSLDKIDGSVVKGDIETVRSIALRALRDVSLEELKDLPYRARPMLAEICLIFLWQGPLTRQEALYLSPTDDKDTGKSKTSETKGSESETVSL